MLSVANVLGGHRGGTGLLMGRKRIPQRARLRLSRPGGDSKVIDWDSDERGPRTALPVLQLYRWADLVHLSEKLAPMVRQGVGDSSSEPGGGGPSSPNREVDKGEKGRQRNAAVRGRTGGNG
jgi:hypothetical protein